MSLNISINEFVNNWIPPHIKWDIMSYVLECPIKKEELQLRIWDMENARVDAEEIPYWLPDIGYEYAVQEANEEWAERLDCDSPHYDPIHFNGSWVYIENERFYLKFFTSPHLFKKGNNSLTFSKIPKPKIIKKWLTDNKVKGRSQYKSAKDWKIAVKLIMSVQ